MEEKKLVLCTVLEIGVFPWGGQGVKGVNHFMWEAGVGSSSA